MNNDEDINAGYLDIYMGHAKLWGRDGVPGGSQLKRERRLIQSKDGIIIFY